MRRACIAAPERLAPPGRRRWTESEVCGRKPARRDEARGVRAGFLSRRPVAQAAHRVYLGLSRTAPEAPRRTRSHSCDSVPRSKKPLALPASRPRAARTPRVPSAWDSHSPRPVRVGLALPTSRPRGARKAPVLSPPSSQSALPVHAGLALLASRPRQVRCGNLAGRRRAGMDCPRRRSALLPSKGIPWRPWASRPYRGVGRARNARPTQGEREPL